MTEFVQAEVEVMTDFPSKNAKDQLRSIVERIEHLEGEKSEISESIKEIFIEAKGSGFDVAALREIIRRRKKDKSEVAEHDAVVELYMQALGMLSDLPLGQAAIKRELASKVS